jgi:hypothetical protein
MDQSISLTAYAEGSLPAARFDLDRLTKNIAAAVDRGDGSHSFYRADLRSFAAACRGAEGNASAEGEHCMLL